MTRETNSPSMKLFAIVWFGQWTALLGTGMTSFGMSIWAWKVTGLVTALALVNVFYYGSMFLFSPVAGAMVDRSNRKLIMILSILLAGVATLGIFGLYVSGMLQVWHLYITGALAGVSQAFQFPAYASAATLMVSKKQYTRASGMISLAESASGVLAPVMAGALLDPIGVNGILLINLVTCVLAIGTLLFVRIPQPSATAAGRAGQGNLWQESYYGLRYIYVTPSILGILLIFLFGNMMNSLNVVVLNPMILARTGDNAMIVGSVQAIGAIGAVAGGLLLSTWGGPKRKIYGILVSIVIGGLLGDLWIGLGQNLVVWSIAVFIFESHVPFVVGSYRAILMAKVPPDVQGRVFASGRLVSLIASPLAMLLAGPLADQVFEPALMPTGVLAGVLGGVVGTGRGSGMALMFVIGGVLLASFGVCGYAIRVIRNAEDLLPDHDAAVSPIPSAAEGPEEERVLTPAS